MHQRVIFKGGARDSALYLAELILGAELASIAARMAELGKTDSARV